MGERGIRPDVTRSLAAAAVLLLVAAACRLPVSAPEPETAPGGELPPTWRQGVPEADGPAEPWAGYGGGWVEPAGHNPGGGLGYGGYCSTGTSKAYGGGPGIPPCMASGCPEGFVCVETGFSCGWASGTDCAAGCPAGTSCVRGELLCAAPPCGEDDPCHGGPSMQCDLDAAQCAPRPGAEPAAMPDLRPGICEQVGCPVGMACGVEGHCECGAVWGGLVVGSRLVGKPCTSNGECDPTGTSGAPTICQLLGEGAGFCEVPCSIVDDTASYCLYFAGAAGGGPDDIYWPCHGVGLCASVCVSDEECVRRGLGTSCGADGRCEGLDPPYLGGWAATTSRWRAFDEYASPAGHGGGFEECPLPARGANRWIQGSEAGCTCSVLGGGMNSCSCTSYVFASDGTWRAQSCTWDEDFQEPVFCGCDEGTYRYSCGGVLDLQSTCFERTERHSFRVGNDGYPSLDGDAMVDTPDFPYGCDQGC